MTYMENHDPDDAVAMYIREASNVEPLTKEEEANYFENWAVWTIGAIWTNRGKCREKIDRKSAHVGREHRTKTFRVCRSHAGIDSRGQYRSDERR